MEYYAKTANSDGYQETVKAHLEKVSNLAAEYGKPIGAEDAARLSGILHDFGKYSTTFQKVLTKEASRIDHAGPGAAFLNNIRGKAAKYTPCIEVINGHHGGLVCKARIGILDSLVGAKPGDIYTNFDKKCSLPNEDGETIATQVTRFLEDFPDFVENYLLHVKQGIYDSQTDSLVVQMLMTRMLYSCLVDADYSASAEVDDASYFAYASGDRLNAREAEAALDSYMEIIRAGSKADPIVDAVRNELFQNCADAGSTTDWLMTVTAPTGAGKTLALLKLALRKCQTLGLSRIIVVLPFLSIAEQTEDECRKIIPNLITDHSQTVMAEEQRELASRWDAPCVITTSVKFFESLFAKDGPPCRKLHNIANSVVIFDEAQTLPSEITKPTIEAIMTLCERCRVSMVLSTATQPAFEYLDPKWKPTEVVRDIPSMYQRMTRVKTEWRVDTPTPLVDIAAEMEEASQSCCITNLKAHALKVFNGLNDAEGSYLMSTALCPAHRREILKAVRKRLDEGEPCHVSATQCIEAGVSIDFPVMYRALAPLSSISQAAGRCNRHGTLGHLGKFVVFKPVDTDGDKEFQRIYPSEWYQNASMVTKGELMEYGNYIDINDPAIIHEYFRRLFASHKDDRKLMNAIELKDYAEVAKRYKLIRSGGYEIIVPYCATDEAKKAYTDVKEAMIGGDGVVSPKLLKGTTGITVATFASEEDIAQVCEPIYVWNPRLKEAVPSGKYILLTGAEYCYNERTGLEIPQSASLSGTLMFG